MLLPKFELLEPTALDDATAILARSNGETKVIAGGTDLLVQMKARKLRPKRLLSITALEELRGMHWEERGLRIGALVTHTQIEASQRAWAEFAALAEACRLVGSHQIRNVGTLGGNLCNAAPSAEAASPLLVLEARVTVVGSDGTAILPLKNFFLGPGKTVLQAHQLLRDVFVPYAPPGSGSAYLKHSPRDAMDIAAVGVAAHVTLDKSGVRCREVRIALGAVAPTPLLAEAAGAVMQGRPLSEEYIGKAARLAAAEAKPISDVRATAGYRREMVQVLTERALILAGERASRDPGPSRDNAPWW